MYTGCVFFGVLAIQWPHVVVFSVRFHVFTFGSQLLLLRHLLFERARLRWKDTNAIEKMKMVSKRREVSALLYISTAPPHPRWCCCCGEENGLYKNGKKKIYQLHIASKMGGNHPRVISCKQSPMGQVAVLDWMPQSAPARFSLPRSERRSWSSRSCPFLFHGEVSLIFFFTRLAPAAMG